MPNEPIDFRALFESVPGAYLVLDPELRILAVSDRYLEATRTRREAIVGRHIFDVFPDNPDDPAASGVANLKASLLRVLETRAVDAMAVQKYDIRRPGSETEFEERFWSPVNSPVLGERGELLYIVHAVQDVTELMQQKQLSTRQREQAAELKTRMEIEILLRAQQIQEANKALRLAQEELQQRVETRTADLHRTSQELEREAATRRKAEEQLRQSQKMEAVGRLAGGIAHDFNNMLSVVLSYTHFVMMELPQGSSAREDLEQVKLAAQRASTLTRQLLAFSRQQVLQPRPLGLNSVVSNMEKMLERLLGEDIELTLVLHPDLGLAKADPSQIEQVIMNLAVNARDAMPAGGKLTLETANVELDETYAKGRVGVSPGRYVMLAVSDTGMGMDAELQARVFEPFFTTKGQGQGTGLGLATVHGIVQQSGGSIGLYSEVGRGTTFKVYLPRVTESGEIEAAEPSTELPPVGGNETLLLVEDEDLVRGAARGILARMGYTILEAHTPAEALMLVQRYSGPIHLMLTDVVMPGMSGRHLAERIAPLRRDMLVVYMSGYTDDTVVRHGVLDGGMEFLQKPFTPDTLSKKVRQVLDKRGRGK